MVVNVNVATEPSLTVELEAARAYVGTAAALDVSLIRIEAVLSWRLML